MNVTTISNFRKDTKSYFDQVIDKQETLIITRNDGQTVVVVSLDRYNSQVETNYLNSTTANKRHLQMSINSLKTGKLQKHKLVES